MPTISVTLSETEWRDLMREAAQQGLPTETMVHQMVVARLREQTREREWRERLGAAFDALHANLSPGDPAEIEAEISAARAEVTAARVARRS